MPVRNGERDRGKERFWRRMMVKQRRAGLTVREFCQREVLKESAFYFWRRELARRDADQAVGCASRLRGRGTPLVLANGRHPKAFLPVAIDAVGEATAGTIEIRLLKGTTLRLSGVDAATLGMVLKAVRG